MGLFDRDRMYGGTYFEDAFALQEVSKENSRNGRLKGESEPFIVWECLGVTAERIDTKYGEADKVSFIVSRMDTPAERFEVGTLAAAIRDMVKYALDNAAEEIGDPNAPFSEKAKIAFADLPAVAKLQKIESRTDTRADATVLTFISLLNDHPEVMRIHDAVTRAERAARRKDFGERAPF